MSTPWKTIYRVVKYLEEIGLEVIGPVYDSETNEVMPPCGSFSPDEVVSYVKAYRAGKLWEATEEEQMARAEMALLKYRGQRGPDKKPRKRRAKKATTLADVEKKVNDIARLLNIAP